MARQTEAQKADAERLKNAEQAAQDLMAGDGDAAATQDAAVATRVAEHDNTADKALVAQMTAKDIEAAELKAEIDKLRAELAQKQQAGAPVTNAAGEEVSASKAVTFWLADPRSAYRIYDEESQGYIQFRGGKYIATNQREVDLIEQHAAGIAFKQDRDKAIGPHPTTGYSPLSDAAYQAHVNLVTRA